MADEGVVHTHDRRICWHCGGQGIVAGAISLRIVERTLMMIGWRYVNEPGGRMICPECRAIRRHPPIHLVE
jgi:hypothetical protein